MGSYYIKSRTVTFCVYNSEHISVLYTVSAPLFSPAPKKEKEQRGKGRKENEGKTERRKKGKRKSRRKREKRKKGTMVGT